ncbi:MAG: 23S rRNA (adenine(2503)-C(2))-methyltransferase RlmN [Micropepsaceae bacterium]
MKSTKTKLVGLTRDGLKAALAAAGVDAKHLSMRSNQLWNAMYVQGVTDFDGITTLAKPLRQEFDTMFSLARPEVTAAQESKDGTRKWLIKFEPGIEIESVFIPDEDRGTLCISSQVGCTLTCRFCHTGTQKLVRNLTASEIVSQVLVARDHLLEWPKAGRNSDMRQITNIVMMGMGEPLYNFENVRDAINIVADGEGLSVSKRRITLSTAGVVPQIPRAGDEIGSMLAISLHAARDEIRDVIVPLNKKYPIKELLQACRDYPGLSNARRITFEYVMLKGVNDSNADARELVQVIRGIPAKINLIPFNAWPNAPYECSDWERIEEFGEIVNSAGYASPIRTPRGRDIMAACGQLKSESTKQRASDRLAELRSREIGRMPN